jgi:hypothetical protein
MGKLAKNQLKKKENICLQDFVNLGYKLYKQGADGSGLKKLEDITYF